MHFTIHPYTYFKNILTQFLSLQQNYCHYSCKCHQRTNSNTNLQQEQQQNIPRLWSVVEFSHIFSKTKKDMTESNNDNNDGDDGEML